MTPINPGAFRFDPLGLDEASFKRSIANRLVYSVGKDAYTAKPRDWYCCLAYALRDRLMERWMETMRSYYRQDAKRVYYLSLEFLIGRTLVNSVLNMDVEEETRKALLSMGLDLEELRNQEPDAALGNGGLGRLAACFLDSMATLRLPGYGYGIRYEYGMFNQTIKNGNQIETPENWLRYGNPWEFPRPEILYPVHFYGRVVEYPGEDGRAHYHWVETEDVMAMAYDTPVPGYHVNTVNNMRLWSAKSTREFELKYFNEGNYIKAVEDKNHTENISRVLYPDDTTMMGRELRLKQQYFFVSASLQDILHRYMRHRTSYDDLPDKVAIQLNDTHPSIAVAELMRLLVDTYHLEWDKAWALTRRVFAYTNHTLMPEALETWEADLIGRLLPRHMQIIYEINHRFLEEVRHKYPGDTERMRRMSLIDERGTRRVRMAHLAIVGSHKVNGVSQIHTDLMRDTIFKDFDQCYPDRIINITNGVTPRRWVNQANPGLSKLVSSRIRHDWIGDLGEIEQLAPFADDAAFRAEFRAVKRDNKLRLAHCIEQRVGIRVNVDSLFDVQIKRIHEYKRQLLNVLHIVTLYNQLRSGTGGERAPRTVIFGGKAAPGYAMAKLIIRLIHDVGDVVNNDPCIGDRLKVAFIPNYDVSTAGDIIPAAELSEQISTVGTEASGTGNMKLGLNGALTIGTLDGANVEMREAVGEDNFFLFGLDRDGLDALNANGYDPRQYYEANAELQYVLEMIGGGFFSPDEPARYRPIVDALLNHGDRFLLLADYTDYMRAQQDVDRVYRDPEDWTRRAILNIARLSRFSSDRTIMEYANRIWGVVKVERE
ncbi:MAG: glycogen/starch/alpha-glucan phosphorylase [Gammaproteobacteria bacterium]|nr:glycogen/starch/alpha-glucan phosphorylase [Gammaproteobacteria bacterium]